MYRMYRYVCLVLVICLATLPQIIYSGGVAPGDTVVIVSSGKSHSPSSSHNSGGGGGGGVGGTNGNSVGGNSQSILSSHHHHQAINPGVGGGAIGSKVYHHLPTTAGSGHIDHRNSYNLLSEAMSQAVSHEFSSLGSGSADGACHVDDLDCYSGNIQDRLGMEAIRSLHRQLDDDDNGNIDLSESDDFLREELKYDSGYEKRQKAFHFNDDMHISVRELWEAWLRSEVHNWTIEQTTDWLAQSVQLPQYVDLFKQHKVAGAALPRLAVNNMHYVSNVLGIKDPIHKQKIALKAMDVVLFGPPRETGTRWKDYILVTLLLSAIIGCWYAYQQNKNAKRHLRRMAQDMEGLQRAEVALQEMQKVLIDFTTELELARMAQENVATEKLDLERRLKEAPSLSSSSSDLELLQLKQEIEMLRNELSRAEIELVDHCWSPPAQLKAWLQYTYELENKYHLQKRVGAEKQLQCAREACEKLRRKRTSLVGAFVSTHGKSIDDVDRSIVEARNSLSEVTMELQERVHRWKQIETMLGFQIANNNGLAYLENVLYNRNGAGSGSSGSSICGKNSRGRLTNSTDDLDDDSVQGMGDSYSRNSVISDRGGGGGGGGGCGNYGSSNRDDSSEEGDNQSVNFYLGSNPGSPSITALNHLHSAPSLTSLNINNSVGNCAILDRNSSGAIQHNSHPVFNSHDSTIIEEKRSPSVSSERSVPIPPRNKKPSIPISSNQQLPSSTSITNQFPPPPPPTIPIGRTPLPPPRRLTSQQSQQQFSRTQSTDTVPLEHYYSINTSYKTSSGYSSIPVITNHSTTTTTTASATATTTTISATTTTATATISSNATSTINVITSSSTSIPSTSISSIPNSFNTKFPSPTTATTTPISSTISFINTDINNPSTTTNGYATTTTTNSIGRIGSELYTITSTTHYDTISSSSKQQIDDTISTDSSNISDEQKKRRRKLRFPFGKSKSNKSKLA